MTANVVMGQAPFTAIGSPVIADGVTPSKAALSNTSYQISMVDTTGFQPVSF